MTYNKSGSGTTAKLVLDLVLFAKISKIKNFAKIVFGDKTKTSSRQREKMSSMHDNDSKSLWNYTLSPGWTKQEVEAFRLALMKFGMGRWTAIVMSNVLPGKTVGQLNNQMQRMIGQQSTNEFQGLHIDPKFISIENEKKEGVRKNGCLINTGLNPTREIVRRKREENKKKWGLSQEEIDAIVLPVLSTADMGKSVSTELTENERREKLIRLQELQADLELVRAAKRSKAAAATSTD
jgi:hypothetical protein